MARTYNINKFILPNGDICNLKVDGGTLVGASMYFVEGPSSDTTPGIWTGEINGLESYYNGLTIVYVPKIKGATDTTLNINDLGAIQCYYNGTTKLTTQYPVGTPILLTYYSGKWMRADYNSNTTYTSKAAAQGGTAVSLVTTGEKYLWNNNGNGLSGPDSSTDGHVAAFDGDTGKVIKDSGFTIAKSVPADAKFTDTTYTSKSAASGGTAVSLVTTGEKYVWNNTKSCTSENVKTALGTGSGTSKYLREDGTWVKPPNTTYSEATEEAAGLMSSSDKTKLGNAVSGPANATNGNVAVYDGTTGKIIKDSGFIIGKSVPANAVFTDTTYTSKAAASGGTEESLVTTGEKYTWDSKVSCNAANVRLYLGVGGQSSSNQKVFLAKDGNWREPTGTTYSEATEETAGLMSSGDKAKLNNAVSGPASATNSHIAVFDGATGKSIKDSGFTIGKSVPSDAVFTDTTYSCKTAVSGGTEESLVTTGDKYAWDNKVSCTSANVRLYLGVGGQSSSNQKKFLAKDGNWYEPAGTWIAMVGATATENGSVGYVNAVPPKDGYNTKFLRADGVWAVPTGEGTTYTAGTGISIDSNNVISNTGVTSLAAGTGISIGNNNTITNTGITSLVAGEGIVVSGGNTITNSGVTSVVTGLNNGCILVNTPGNPVSVFEEVAVKGLAAAAYREVATLAEIKTYLGIE